MPKTAFMFTTYQDGWLVLGFFGLCSVIGVIPLLPKRWFAGAAPSSFIRRLRGEVQIPDPKYGVLELESEGLGHTLLDGNRLSIRWDQIDRITTYKLDLLTTDCICLLFEGRFDASPYQIHEEMMGFGQVFKALRDAFPGISEFWYFDVTTPAFERNETILFERDKVANERGESDG